MFQVRFLSGCIEQEVCPERSCVSVEVWEAASLV